MPCQRLFDPFWDLLIDFKSNCKLKTGSLLLTMSFFVFVFLLLGDMGYALARVSGDRINNIHRRLDNKHDYGPAQRCFDASCQDGKVVSETFPGAQKIAWFVIYDEKRCKGNFIKVPTAEGLIDLRDTGWYLRPKSYMLWESGIYPTRGFYDYCPEERAHYFRNDSSRSTIDHEWTSTTNSSTHGDKGIFIEEGLLLGLT